MAPTPLRIPTAYQLHAAVLAARVLDADGSTKDALLQSYANVATGGLYRSDDLRLGATLLERAGLVLCGDVGRYFPSSELLALRNLPDDVVADLLLQEVLTVEPPLWLFAAVVDEEVRWENVPDAELVVLGQTVPDPDRREAMLLAIGRKFDQERLTVIGDAGEDFVVAACRGYFLEKDRADLAAAVERVSTRSDTLGYDLSASDSMGRRHRIEVKTTSARVGRLQFYISRNEATVALRDPAWSLVVVRRGFDDSLAIVGWCRGAAIASYLPSDAPIGGRWSAARLDAPDGSLEPGLPLDQP